MHSVKVPYSHRPRYMRAAPIDLQLIQNTLNITKKEPWTNKIVTASGRGTFQLGALATELWTRLLSTPVRIWKNCVNHRSK